MKSLRTRLLVSATVVLAAFILLSAAALERAFRNAALQTEQDKLRGLIYALLGAAEFDPDGRIAMPDGQLPDPLLRQPGSGLEAAIFDEHGRRLWSSPSLLRELARPAAPDVGRWHFREAADPERFTLAFGVRWIDDSDRAAYFTFAVAEDPAAYRALLTGFRQTLGFGLAATAATLLVAQLLLLGRLLRPLTRLVDELGKVEKGAAEKIAGDFPSELAPLTDALNAMIQNERNRQTRYRNALDDLAHSLKTPLAALRGIGEEPGLPDAPRERMREQLGRMESIADHQLRKAATAGRRRFGEPVTVKPLAEKTVAALSKVYSVKRIRFALAVSPTLRLRVDEGDLYELLGNLLDNAAKWCDQEVTLTATQQADRCRLQVEDDGRGFPPDAEKLLARGARADSRVPGQGLGLAAVDEIARAYDGGVELGRSPMGGARVTVELMVA
ncbi:MAG: GHKL domain-containing protein [Gammaproteobacteria bacterium]|nr:GHKL domain-containing protein [Gammaproteobacteria bacterium]